MFDAHCVINLDISIGHVGIWIFRILCASPATKSAIRAGHCVGAIHNIQSCANGVMALTGAPYGYGFRASGDVKGTFPRARSGCGADLGRRPLKAAARGCTFPLRRIRSGTVADPPGLVINIYLQLISLHDGAVGVTDLGVMLLWSSADKGIWPI